MPRIALYPGSFDPVTNGHLDVVQRAVHLCDRLIVAVGVHSSKAPLFSTEERLNMVSDVFAPVAAKAGCGFEATTYDNLTVAAAQKSGATLMIRGLRDSTDLDYEMQLAGMNQTMAPDVETVFAQTGSSSGGSGFGPAGGSDVSDGTITVVLKNHRSHTTDGFKKLIRPMLRQIPDVRITTQGSFGAADADFHPTGQPIDPIACVCGKTMLAKEFLHVAPPSAPPRSRSRTSPS